jgi:indolepyruvate ferredoxin oxidoreductase alpha subunit
MKKLMTGNEAIARGAYEAGISFAAAYPGTPSTEILENVAQYKEDIMAEWAPNEKVALESVIGASIAGGRALAAMKHVGVNVAADPLFTFAYTGVNGGAVIVSADEPDMHSSQNEQDNRRYAKFAKVAMLEPSDSQEAKDMVIEGIKISEKFDIPVLLRMTTRICHSKTLVELGERKALGKKPYVKDLSKYDAVPAVSRKLHKKLEANLIKMEDYSNQSPFNFTEYNDKTIGIITNGIAYQYAKEVFGKDASYLKLGMTFPLPTQKIKDFAASVEKVYVIEELEPVIEEHLKINGIECIGKELLPNTGEFSTTLLREKLLNETPERIDYDEELLVPRPPTLCAGCPHRGFYVELAKRDNVMITGDIGCYGLGAMDPLNALDTTICMGASISMGHGAQRVFDWFGEEMRNVSVIGDSTFFHTGVNSLLDVIYNQSNTITCILDNRVTAMTGHQENPGSGYTLQGRKTKEVAIEPMVKGMGVEHVKTVNPLNLKEMRETLNWAFKIDEPSVIITRWPCVLKEYSNEDLNEFGKDFTPCIVDEDKCIGCKQCIETGCPALIFNDETQKVRIDDIQCVGCTVCMQVCPVDAITKVGDVDEN